MKFNTFNTFISLLLVLTSAFVACKKLNLCEDDNLSMPKTTFTGNQLRIDGIYHATFENDSSFALLVFYANGLFLTSTETNTSLSAIEAQMIDGSFYEKKKNAKTNWGLYQVDNGLTTEGWKKTPGCYPALQLTGEIINDSTITIGNLMLKDNLSLTYHFKSFQPKPDSTNCFIN